MSTVLMSKLSPKREFNHMERLKPMILAGVELRESRHICAFFGSAEEEHRALLPFVQDGLTSGDRVVHILNPQERQRYIEQLSEAGIDTAKCQASGQLHVANNDDIYLRDGVFDPDRMLMAFEELASGGKAAQGFPRSRILCRMDCVTGDSSRMDKVIEFEARVNDLWQQHDDAVICTYNLSLLSGDAVMDILRTHPLVIVGSLLQQNPFFIPPAEFLRTHRGTLSCDAETD
jgi:hypothetical protein